jgi:hypothetical protein
MESWRKVWREGAAPQLSTKGLLALRDALLTDDPRLIQGVSTMPPPPECGVQDLPCEAACLIGYAGWQGDGLNTVGEVEEFFDTIYFKIENCIDEPAACGCLIKWFDKTPRDEMRRNLLQEVNRSLAERNHESQKS